jgi:ABC-type multidrug transport system permease subunit
MYRASPFTYFVAGVLSTGLAGVEVQCSEIELLNIKPPEGQACGSYLDPYVNALHGKLINPESSADCKVCSLSTTDQFLAAYNIHYSQHSRNIGILFAFVGFNIVMAFFLYWLLRVPKHRSRNGKA